MSNYQDQSRKENDFIIMFFVFLFLIFLLVYFYDYYKYYIHIVMLNIAYYQFLVLSYLGFDTAKEGVEVIVNLNMNDYPETVTYAYLLGESCKYTRWIVVPIMLWGVWRLWSRSILERFNRMLSPDDLVKMNARIYPKLRPVLFWNLNKEDTVSGPWRLAYQPIQFAVINELLILPDGSPADKNLKKGTRGLVLDEAYAAREDSPCLMQKNGEFNPHYALKLDKNKTELIFAEQVNKPFDLAALKDYERAMLAALLAFACDNKKAAFKMFDYMSASFDVHRKVRKEKRSFIDFIKGKKAKETITSEKYTVGIPPETNKFIKKYIEDPRVKDLLQLHGYYFYPFMLGLALLAKKKGILTTADFIWLRPMDTLFFRVLNAAGGGTCWAECAGVFAHYEAEEVIKRTLADIYVKNAYEALHARLEDGGWLPVIYTKEPDMEEQAKPKSSMKANLQGGRTGGFYRGEKGYYD